MNAKTIIKLILIIGLILLAGYLAFSLVSENTAQTKDVQNFCMQKCNYNSDSLFWEFSSDNGTKGFTTKDECFNYCSKVKMGFAYVLNSYSASFLNALSNILKR